MRKIIHLEDQGQDLLRLVIENGSVIEEQPINRGIFIGGGVPDFLLEVGQPCPMHCPPNIVFGYLKYNVSKIELYDSNKTTEV